MSAGVLISLAETILGGLLQVVHQGIGENLLLVLGIAQQVAGGEDRPGGDQSRQFLRRGDRHFEVAAGNRLKLGALLEERGVPVRLQRREILHGRAEDFGHRHGALVRRCHGCRKAQGHALRQCRRHAGPEGGTGRASQRGIPQQGAAIEFHRHAFLPVRIPDGRSRRRLILILTAQP